MSESSIWVKPATEANRVKVKTEKIGDAEVPVYVPASGDGTLTSDNNPLPAIQSVYLIDGFETTIGITGSTDVSNIAQSTDHLGVGQYSASFDKSGTTQNYALIQKTITAIDLTRFTGTYDVEFAIKLPSLTDVSLVYVALGSSSSNAIYWQTSTTDLVVGWNTVNKGLKYPEDQVGDGIDYSSISWIGIYVGFNSTANTLTGIKADNVELHPTAVHKLEDISGSLNNAISVPNSRAASTLAASGTFQGTVEDVSNFGRAGISIKSDNATDGVLTIETSHDNVIWGGPTRTWANTSIATPHMWNIVEKYFRILYTNGTTEATNLSIQVQYSNNANILLGHQLNEILTEEVEATIVRPGTSFDLDAARKHVTGQRAFFFFGFNDAVGTSWVDIHPAGGNINWQTTAAKVKVASSDAADNGTTPGLGVQSVEIHGLSATGEDQDEIVLTNGTAAVESSLTYIRVNKMHSETCGTYGGSHQGDIECRVTNATFANGDLLSKMTGEEGSVDTAVVYGSGEAANGYWTIPLGKVLYITRLEVIPNVSANKNVTVRLYERENILDVTTPFSPRRIIWGEDGIEKPLTKEFKSHIKIKSLTDLWFRAKASATSKIQVSLDFYLVDADADGA